MEEETGCWRKLRSKNLHDIFTIFFSVIKDMRLVSVKMKEYTNKCTILQYKIDLLRAGRSGDRIPVEARFSAPVQTGAGAHPASYTIGALSFPGVKQPGRDVDNPPHLAPRLKKEYIYTCYRVNFTFYLFNTKLLQLNAITPSCFDPFLWVILRE